MYVSLVKSEIVISDVSLVHVMYHSVFSKALKIISDAFVFSEMLKITSNVEDISKIVL